MFKVTSGKQKTQDSNGSDIFHHSAKQHQAYFMTMRCGNRGLAGE